MRRLLLMYNSNAKRGKVEKILPHIQKRLSDKFQEIEMHQGGSSEELKNYVKENVSNYDMLVILGGDGTLHSAINGLVESGAKVPVGILPFGTVNDVAKCLGIPKKLDEALNIILKGNDIDYDILTDGKEYSVYTYAGGLFVRASFETKALFKKIFGKIVYYIKGLRDLFRLREIPITVKSSEYNFHGKCVLTLILNSHSVAGLKLKGMGSVSDGKMDVVLIERKRSYFKALFSTALVLLFGINKAKKYKCIHYFQTDKLYIENHSNTPFSTDGEKIEFLQREITMTESVKICCNK